MPRKVAQSKGVYCLETDQWYGQKNRASVEPALHLLEKYIDMPYQHRDVATEAEFRFFLDRYFQRGYKTHAILCLGFHGGGPVDGEDAFVEINDGTRVSLARLEERKGSAVGAWSISVHVAYWTRTGTG